MSLATAKDVDDVARLLNADAASDEEEVRLGTMLPPPTSAVAFRVRPRVAVTMVVVAAGVALHLALSRGLGRPLLVASAVDGGQKWQGAGCEWISQDNCVNEDQFACQCRAANPDGPCTACPGSHKRVPDPAPAPSSPNGQKRKGSFLVIGDWGYDFACHGNVPNVGCQQLIADKMLEKFRELGDVKFIINVGDSFYPHGVMSRTDPQWESKWRRVYAPELRSVPWYTVYGNHDLQRDPCMCSDTLSDCAQVNADHDNLDFFFMPDVSWYRELPDLGVEILGLDLNHYMLGYDGNRNSASMQFEDCQYTSCEAACRERSKRRAREAFELFKRRIEASTAKTLIAFSHYPTDYFRSEPWFLQGLSDARRRHILYLGGHRHNIDQASTIPITPNVGWLVGGGGGWSCDGSAQGFLVGEIMLNSQIATYPLLVDTKACCQNQGPSPWKGGGKCDWTGCDNCIDDSFCGCRALNPDGPCTQCPNSQRKGRICSGTECSDGHFPNATTARRL